MSFPRYPTYKDSGVEWLGAVPGHWGVQRLKRLAAVFPSNVDKKSVEGELPVRLCNYTDVYYNDRIVDGMEFMEATATREQIEKFALRRDDVIITKDSETADDIAIAAYVPEDIPGVVCGYHLSMVRPGAEASGAFVKWLFGSAYARASLEVRANGLTRVGLGQYAVDNVELPAPPHREQVLIAAFLDRETARIDALVAEQERLIELLREKRQAVISHAVTKGLDPDVPMKDSGVEWLGEVPAHWELLPMKRLIGPVDQGGSPQCESEPAPLDRWGVLKVGCMNGGVFRQDEQKALPEDVPPDVRSEIREGDILMSRGNTLELVGSAAVVPSVRPKLLLSDLVYRFRARTGVSPRFLCYVLGSAVGRHQIERDAVGTSASMKKVSKEVLANLTIPSPGLEEQGHITAFLDEHGAITDTLITSATRAITLLEERRSALITAAVTGQIDVRGVA